MSQCLETLLATDAQRYKDAQANDAHAAVVAGEFQDDDYVFEVATKRAAKAIIGRDLLDELVDVQDLLAELALKGDAATIGAVVVAVHRAYAARCAHYGAHDNQFRILPSAVQAARVVTNRGAL